MEVDGIPMVVAYVANGPTPVALATEDGREVAWGKACLSGDFDDREEVLCVDVLSGARYWMCFFCRGIVGSPGSAHA